MDTSKLNYEEAIYLGELYVRFTEEVTFELYLEQYLKQLEKTEQFEDAAFLKNILKKIDG